MTHRIAWNQLLISVVYCDCHAQHHCIDCLPSPSGKLGMWLNWFLLEGEPVVADEATVHHGQKSIPDCSSLIVVYTGIYIYIYITICIYIYITVYTHPIKGTKSRSESGSTTPTCRAYSRSIGPACVQLKLLACGCLTAECSSTYFQNAKQWSNSLIDLHQGFMLHAWYFEPWKPSHPEPSGRRTRGVALIGLESDWDYTLERYQYEKMMWVSNYRI